jgi:hypothetical protein
MRAIAAVLSLMIFAASGLGEARAADAEIVAAINASSNALDNAFEKSENS